MVTLALVGAGQWGKNYLGAARQIEGVEITYITTSHTDIEGVPRKLDGVIIASPAKTHYALAKHFLEDGRNILVEKPLALSVAEANALQESAKKSGSKVLVGHLQLYNPAYRAAKALVPSLGEVKKISFRGLVSPPRKDVSVLWDWGPHPASLFLDLIDTPLKDVSADGNNEHVTFELTFGSGTTATAEIGWEGLEKKRELIIQGTEGKITFDDTKREQKGMVELHGKSPSFPSYDQTPPLTIQLTEFVSAIRDGEKIYSGIETGVRVTELLARVKAEVFKHSLQRIE